jgi:hypothetical protein
VAEAVLDTSTHTEAGVAAVLPDMPLIANWYAPSGELLGGLKVTVGVCAVVLLKVSEEEENVHVGYSDEVAPVGALVTEQLSVTVPVNELPGVTVTVTALEVAPGATVTLAGLAVTLNPVVVEVLGASQKSPHPVRKQSATGAAASIQREPFTILIPAPLFAANRPRHLLGSAYRVSPCGASCLAAEHTDAARYSGRRKGGGNRLRDAAMVRADRFLREASVDREVHATEAGQEAGATV